MAAFTVAAVEGHRYAALTANPFHFSLKFMAVHDRISHIYVRIAMASHHLSGKAIGASVDATFCARKSNGPGIMTLPPESLHRTPDPAFGQADRKK
jgi:hypothetical protein